MLARIFPSNFCSGTFGRSGVHPRCTTHYYRRSSEHECTKGIVGGEEATISIGLTNAKRQGGE
jgi:hypothetical protein